MRIRLRLIELNRAVCLECPEFQVPWFHDRFCQQLQRKGNGNASAVQQQIHKMLGEILGGINYAKASSSRLISMQSIPHFEWNSMELSKQDAWKEYLRKKLVTDHS
ncbi:FAST kinase domain-containing protein 1 [Acipenser ruthenus]|uniref:FAST kinase domain-containing protein 1 n=1 Tax=Acipenser ruthenus TaxID=7906 RepID=A0A444TZ37_ACIRT|nr:FAST kinase domain-containing protein 1 [Acipenser ruthenus]